MFTPALQDSLKLCVEYAERIGNAEIYSEHLLYALLLENGAVVNALGLTNEAVEAMKVELLAFLEKMKPDPSLSMQSERRFSKNCQKILEKGIFWGKTSGYLLIEGWHIIVAMLSEPKSFVYNVLAKRHISQKKILRFFMLQDPFQGGAGGSRFARQASAVSAEQTDQSIDHCLIHLTDPAIAKNLDPVIGREGELLRVAQILCRRKKNNPLLVGEAGVGKTAIIEGLARQILEKKVPEALQNAQLYSLDLAALLSGTKYRGDLEKRFRYLITKFEGIKNGILAIDEAHLIVGAGASSGGHVDLANLLKPLMAAGALRVLGATTHQEYQHSIEKDKALTRRFQLVPVFEPSPDDAVKILRGVQSRYEAHHNVKYSHVVIQSIVDFSSRFSSRHVLPDKALDLLDELGSSVQLRRKGNKQHMISTKDLELIEKDVSQNGQFVPLNLVNGMMATLSKKLKARIFGQDKAINELVTLLKLSSSGLRTQSRPIVSILLSGASGTGKTEFALTVAQALERPLLRLDMSEYVEPQTVSRLLGAPPGYIGNDRGGLLTDAILKKPNTLILVDELEKAHLDILNLFLQIMDGGFLTDANGRQICFSQTLLIMTSNLGAEDLDKTSVGFQKKLPASESLEKVQSSLTPEFRNRLDRILVFEPLTEAVQLKILNRALNDLTLRLKERHGLSLQLTRAARQWIITQWKDTQKSREARSLLRWLETLVQLPLSEELLSKKFEKGSLFLIDIFAGKLVFTSSRSVAKTRPKAMQSQEVAETELTSCPTEKP